MSAFDSLSRYVIETEHTQTSLCVPLEIANEGTGMHIMSFYSKRKLLNGTHKLIHGFTSPAG
jgi:hypothetical protein